jgi:hypothetical protein
MRTFLQSMFFLTLVTQICFAQQYDQNSRNEKSPILAPYNNQGADITTYWELFFTLDLTAATGGSANSGVEFDGTYFYTTRWDSNLMYKYDINGNLLEEFTIPGVWGIRDLAFDGTYMYGGYSSTTILKMDFNTKTVVGTIPSPVQVGYIAYDMAHDAFWCGDWYDNPTLVSRNGTTLGTIYTGLVNQSGAACDGQFLYIFDQGQGPGTPQIISQWNLYTGQPTGDFIDVTEDITGTNGVAGGLFSPENIGYGPVAVGGVLVGNPDMLFIYSNHWYIPPYFETFDNYITGQQLACQDHLYWSTWDLNPCDPVADPYITTNYSFSPPNSVMIVEDNDFVQLHQPLTYGIWIVEFMFYIPAGKTGQFSLMSQFLWAEKIRGMECHFDPGGAGKLFIGDTLTFTWQENTWQPVNIIVNIEDDQAVMNLGSNTIASWQWTRGGTIPLKLDATNFRGVHNSEMYIDNYHFGDYIPVELTSFHADVKDGSVLLSWHTVTETNNKGFAVERFVEPLDDVWKNIGFVSGSGTTTEPKYYSFEDKDLGEGIYKYRLKQINYDGSFHYSDEVKADVSLTEGFTLSQNYPNPFNSVTVIKYRVPQHGPVTLKIYDILGEEVAVAVNETKPAGSYSLKFDGSSLPSGVYIYRLTCGDQTAARKFVLIK